jgi:hypothetical protein
MGKTTLYHPVSLPVIRGAAAYRHFKLGKISQLKSNYELSSASYSVPIVELPYTLPDAPPNVIKAHLDAAMPAEVTVTDVRYIHGKYIAVLRVDLVSNGQMRFA